MRPRRADAAEERAPPPTFDAYVWASALYGIYGNRARCVAPRGARLCTRDALRVLDAPGVCVHAALFRLASVKPDRSLLYTRLSAHAITRVPRTGPCKSKTTSLHAKAKRPCPPIPPRQVGQLPRVGFKVHRTVDVGVLIGRHVRHHHLCHGARGGGRGQRRATATSDSDSLPSSTPPRSRRARRRACRPRLPPRQQPPPSYARACRGGRAVGRGAAGYPFAALRSRAGGALPTRRAAPGTPASAAPSAEDPPWPRDQATGSGPARGGRTAARAAGAAPNPARHHPHRKARRGEGEPRLDPHLVHRHGLQLPRRGHYGGERGFDRARRHLAGSSGKVSVSATASRPATRRATRELESWE